jgi:peptidoglycan/LPS O-acetylase OafA/YrhL
MSSLAYSYVTRQQPSITDFYRRRAYRILPSYLAVLALYFFVPAWRRSFGACRPCAG